MNKYLGLLWVTVIFEVIGTTALKLSQGFTEVLPSIVMVVAYVISFGLFIVILKHLSLGLAYAIWGGAGTVLTLIVGVIIWNDPITLMTGIGVVLVVAGIVLLSQGTEELERKRAAREQELMDN